MKIENKSLLKIIIFSVALCLFVAISWSVSSNPEIPITDIRVNSWLTHLRNNTEINLFLIITYFANTEVILAFLAICSVLFAARKKKYILSLSLTVLITMIAVFSVKLFIARKRPIDPVYFEDSFSFPSNHAAIGLAFYGFLMYIISQEKRIASYRTILLPIGGLFIFLIGLSRLYLGVHFFSDVIGGYLIGLMSLLIVLFLHEKKLFRF